MASVEVVAHCEAATLGAVAARRDACGGCDLTADRALEPEARFDVLGLEVLNDDAEQWDGAG